MINGQSANNAINAIDSFLEQFDKSVSEAASYLKQAYNCKALGKLPEAFEHVAKARRLVSQEKLTLEDLLRLLENEGGNAEVRQLLRKVVYHANLQLAASNVMQAGLHYVAGVANSGNTGTLEEAAKKSLEAAIGKCEIAYNALVETDRFITGQEGRLILWQTLTESLSTWAHACLLLGFDSYTRGVQLVQGAEAAVEGAANLDARRAVLSGLSCLDRALGWYSSVIQIGQEATKRGAESIMVTEAVALSLRTIDQIVADKNSFQRLIRPYEN